MLLPEGQVRSELHLQLGRLQHLALAVLQWTAEPGEDPKEGEHLASHPRDSPLVSLPGCPVRGSVPPV